MGNADIIVQGFTRETSIHGLLRICSPERRWCARGIWVIFFVAANAAFIYQAQQLVVKFFGFPSSVSTSLEFQTLPFPSVTICNQNPFRLDKIEGSDVANYQEYYRQLLENGMNVDPDTMYDLCQESPLLCDGINMQVCTDSDTCVVGDFGPQGGPDDNNINNLFSSRPSPDNEGSTKSGPPGSNGNLGQNGPGMTNGPGSGNQGITSAIGSQGNGTQDITAGSNMGSQGMTTGSGILNQGMTTKSNMGNQGMTTGSITRNPTHPAAVTSKGSTTMSSTTESEDLTELTESTEETPSLRRRKRETPQQVSVSMLQLNTKVTSDMNFLVQTALSSGNKTLMDMYKNVFENITEFIQDCSYGTQQCNISSNFIGVRNPVYGMCFTFNHMRSNMTNMDVTRAGPAFGLRLRLNVDQSQYLYSTDTAGVRVAVHHKDESPFPETVGYNAPIGARTSIGITMVETARMAPPYGKCTNNDDILKGVPYFYGGNYTGQGCLSSCLAIKIVESCGCMHYNYPQLKGNVHVIIDNHTYTIDADGLEFCNTTMKDYADLAEEKLLMSGAISAEACGCNPACNEISYQTSISSSTFPSDMYMETTNCPRNTNSASEECYDEVIYNQLQLEVFYMQLNYQKYNTEASYTAVQLLSDLGGQLGLWIGASVLSIAEFLSFVLSISGYGMKLNKHDVEMKSNKTGPTSSDESIYKPSRDGTEASMVMAPKPM